MKGIVMTSIRIILMILISQYVYTGVDENLYDRGLNILCRPVLKERLCILKALYLLFKDMI